MCRPAPEAADIQKVDGLVTLYLPVAWRSCRCQNPFAGRSTGRGVAGEVSSGETVRRDSRHIGPETGDNAWQQLTGGDSGTALQQLSVSPSSETTA